MSTVMFDPDPDDAYRKVPLQVAQWADGIVDDLESDPTAAHLRRLRFQTSDNWGAAKRVGDEDWWLLWYQDESDESLIIVSYLGQAPGT